MMELARRTECRVGMTQSTNGGGGVIQVILPERTMVEAMEDQGSSEDGENIDS